MGESSIEIIERCMQNHRKKVDEMTGVTEMHPQEPSQERWDEMIGEEGMRCMECGPKLEKKLLLFKLQV